MKHVITEEILTESIKEMSEQELDRFINLMQGLLGKRKIMPSCAVKPMDQTQQEANRDRAKVIFLKDYIAK